MSMLGDTSILECLALLVNCPIKTRTAFSKNLGLFFCCCFVGFVDPNLPYGGTPFPECNSVPVKFR